MHTLRLLSRDLKLVELPRASLLVGQVKLDPVEDHVRLLTQLASGAANASLTVVLDLPSAATVPGRLAELSATIKKDSSRHIGLVASASLLADESVEAWAQQLDASVVVP